MEVNLGLRSVNGLYAEERGVECRGDSSASSKGGMFNKRVSCLDVEVVVERRTDLALPMVPTVDWD
jgi:hypothetical protein